MPTFLRTASDRHQRRLFVRSRLGPGGVLLRRVVMLASLVGVVLAIFWFDRDGLRDQIDGHVSFADIVYFTAVTVTTVGYGDIVPVSPRARIVDALVVTPLRLVIWLVFLGTTYELVLQRWLENRRMNRFREGLHQHILICGYGHSGQSAAAEALARGTAADRIVVLDREEARLRLAQKRGFVGLLSDATTEQDLLNAGVQRAQAVLVCLGRDDTAVLAVLTVRQLNPTVRIVCSVAEEENLKLLRQAGADALVAPSMVGGYLMADSVRSSHIADYISDLMCTGGRVQLVERAATAAEVGKTMRELQPALAVRLVRGGHNIGFWEGDAARVQAGDVLLLIEPSARTS